MNIFVGFISNVHFFYFIDFFIYFGTPLELYRWKTFFFIESTDFAGAFSSCLVFLFFFFCHEQFTLFFPQINILLWILFVSTFVGSHHISVSSK